MKNIISYATCISVFTTCMVVGCNNNHDFQDNVYFVRDNFAETKIMSDPEIISIDSLLYPASFKVINDSLLVVGNQPVCEYLLEIYSLKSHQQLAKHITKGNGPGEMLSCAVDLHTNTGNSFYLQDYNSHTYYLTNIDTLLNGKRFSPLSSFRYSSDVLINSQLLVFDNDTYLGCNMWYSPEPSFDNGKSSPISFYRKGEETNTDQTSYKFFTAPVNGMLLWKDSKNAGQLWSADMHSDRICIYDDSLKVKRTIVGPDNFELSYEKVQSNTPLAFITFTDKRDVRTYADYFITSEHIYLLYVGTEFFDPIKLPDVEVFKLDFDGNLLCNYKFDRYIYSISIDKSEKFLYCASRENVKEVPVFLKYEL